MNNFNFTLAKLFELSRVTKCYSKPIFTKMPPSHWPYLVEEK